MILASVISFIAYLKSKSFIVAICCLIYFTTLFTFLYNIFAIKTPVLLSVGNHQVTYVLKPKSNWFLSVGDLSLGKVITENYETNKVVLIEFKVQL